MDLPITDFETVLRTTRSVRRRLDPTRPVPSAVVYDCLELALQAPTGGDAQDWRWILVSDPAVRTAIGDVYRAQFDRHVRPYRRRPDESMVARVGGLHPDGRIDARTDRMLDGAEYLAETIGTMPWLVVACASRPRDARGSTESGLYGSIYPAIWSFQLALRSRGLGSVLTTLHLNDAASVARVLAIPDGITQVALLPVAHTDGLDFRPARRRSVDEVAYRDRWGVPFTRG